MIPESTLFVLFIFWIIFFPIYFQAFTRVFGASSLQSDLYVHSTAPLMEKFLQGDSCVLFAYGMTNSGKTYTIQGTDEYPGLFPRLVKDIITKMNNDYEGGDWELQVSMLEIYQEKIFDLLSKDKVNLSIRDGNGQVKVNKLSSHKISSSDDAISLLDTAASRR